MKTLDQVHRRQRLRHVTANKLTLPMTVLRQLHEGKHVPPRLVAQALRDLEAIREFIAGQ